MKTYNIYKHPMGPIEAVKIGWSWPAFFFSWIWAFVKGLNAIGATILIAAILLGIMSMESQFADALITIGGLSVSIWLGAQGNELRTNNLRKKGYEFIKTVNAETPEGALASSLKDGHSNDHNHEYNCPDCGAAVTKTAKFCWQCGTKFE